MWEGFERLYNSFLLRDFSYVTAGATLAMLVAIDRCAAREVLHFAQFDLQRVGGAAIVLAIGIAYLLGLLLSEVTEVAVWLVRLVSRLRSTSEKRAVEPTVKHCKLMKELMEPNDRLGVERLIYLKTLSGSMAMALALSAMLILLSGTGRFSSLQGLVILAVALFCFLDHLRLRGAIPEVMESLIPHRMGDGNSHSE